MSWQKVYGAAKKLHNYSMWGVMGLGLPQLVTGVFLTWPGELGLSTLVVMRSLHAFLAPYFAGLLVLQMVTGLVMWGVPRLLQAKKERA